MGNFTSMLLLENLSRYQRYWKYKRTSIIEIQDAVPNCDAQEEHQGEGGHGPKVSVIDALTTGCSVIPCPIRRYELTRKEG